MAKVTISVDNSYSQITGLAPEALVALRKHFSFIVNPETAFYVTMARPNVKYMINQKGQFPTGLLETIAQHLDKQGADVELKDLRVAPKASKPAKLRSDVKPYASQVEAVSKATAYDRAGIVMPTGSGKSMVIAMLAAKINLPTLIVVPNLEIKKQLRETLDATLLDASHVTVENIDSTDLFKNNRKYNCLIIDECHHAAASTYQKLNKRMWNGIYYRYFLSATFYRNQEHEQLPFEGIAGKIAYTLTYAEAVAAGYIVPVHPYVYAVPRQECDKVTWRDVYDQLVIRNERRNEAIASMAKNLAADDKFVLCLVKEVAHGEALSELSGLPFCHGQDPDSRRHLAAFNAGRIRGLIATTGIAGEGVDTKPCEYVIIAGLGKAKSAFQQQVGRAVRRYATKDSAKVIIFKDPSHKFTLNHFRAQKKILVDEYRAELIEFGSEEQ